MEYLLFIVANLLIAAGLYYRLAARLKKRNKSIEGQIHKINEWVLLSNQALVQQLDAIHKLVTSLHQGAKIVDMHTAGNHPNLIQEKEETKMVYNQQGFTSVVFRNNETMQGAGTETSDFYIAILEELQRINHTIHTNNGWKNNMMGNRFTKKESNAAFSNWNQRLHKRIK